MAKLKKTARAKPAAAASGSADLQAKAEQLSRSLVESAQQIWMAGVGAFTRAQGEGSKLFDALVTEGMNIEKTTRKLASGRVGAVRNAMEDRVGVVRVRASDTWDRLEKVFEDRVQRALNRLGVPGREEIAALDARVNALSTQVRKSGAANAPRVPKPAKSPAARKTVASKNSAVSQAAKKPRQAARKSLPKAKRPIAPHA
ncbi:MAG: phasin family protein [Arenimonas sp.]